MHSKTSVNFTLSAPRGSSYPLSLVDIVENLESKSLGPEVPGAAIGLDTTDSGYSQDTCKERSPLTGESVNSDEEEAAVLEDIFFISGRFFWPCFVINLFFHIAIYFLFLIKLAYLLT